MAGKGAKIITPLIILIIIAVIAAFVSTHYNSITKTNSISPGAIVVQLTDPPQVPAGTQSLAITYAGVGLHLSGSSNSSGFVNVNSTGSVNLLNITNVTQTIGVVNTEASQSFDMVRLNITSAKIMINNTIYNVTVPSGFIDIHLKTPLNTSNGVAGVLIQLNPSIVQIYTANQTLFLLVPSAKALVLGNSSLSLNAYKNGEISDLKSNVSRELEGMTPNITITSASISAVGNNTVLSITLKNNANSSVNLNHLFLHGPMSANIPSIAISSVTNMRPTDNSSSDNGTLTNSDISAILGGLLNSSIIPGLTNITIALGNNTTSINIGNVTNSIENDIASLNTGNLTGSEISGELHGLHGLRNFTNKDLSGLNGLFNHSVTIGNTTVVINSSNIANVTNRLGINDTVDLLTQLKGGKSLNLSIMDDLHNFNSSNARVRELIQNARNFRERFFDALNFMITSNGTLTLPYTQGGANSEAESGSDGYSGYTLAPGSSVTLQFNSSIGLPSTYGMVEASNHSDSQTQMVMHAGNIPILLIANQTYTVTVVGTNGAHVSMNITAG